MRLNIHGLIDNAKCFQMVRRLRWPEGVECPHCHATEITKNGHDETQSDRQRYICRMCNRSFDDLTQTVFAGHHQPLSVWMLCLYFMGLNLSNRQIAEELEMNETQVQEITTILRNGIVVQEPQIELSGTVECDEVYVVAGHKGHPESVKWKIVSKTARRTRWRNGFNFLFLCKLFNPHDTMNKITCVAVCVFVSLVIGCDAGKPRNSAPIDNPSPDTAKETSVSSAQEPERKSLDISHGNTEGNNGNTSLIPLKAYFTTDYPMFVRMEHAMGFYKAKHDNKPPATHDEFMQIIIGNHHIELPQLRSPNDEYRYDPESGELQILMGKHTDPSQTQVVPTIPAVTIEECTELRGHTKSVVSAAFSLDGKQVITASRDATARIWDANSGNELQKLEHKGRIRKTDETFAVVNFANFSPDGKKVVTAGNDGSARIWDANSGKQLHELVVRSDNIIFYADVHSAVFSPDGKRIVTATSDSPGRIWDVESGNEVRKLMDSIHGSNTIAVFSPDGKRIAATSYGAVRVFDAGSGKELHRIGHDGNVESVVFSPDGKKIVVIASSFMGADALILDAESGKELHRLVHTGIQRAERSSITFVAFSPDSKKVVTASKDVTARIWDADTGEELRRLKHEGIEIVWSAVFSPNGKRIVTGSHGAARIWDADSGKELYKMEHSGRAMDTAVRFATFSPDGKKVVTVTSSAVPRIWTLPTIEKQ